MRALMHSEVIRCARAAEAELVTRLWAYGVSNHVAFAVAQHAANNAACALQLGPPMDACGTAADFRSALLHSLSKAVGTVSREAGVQLTDEQIEGAVHRAAVCVERVIVEALPDVRAVSVAGEAHGTVGRDVYGNDQTEIVGVHADQSEARGGEGESCR